MYKPNLFFIRNVIPLTLINGAPNNNMPYTLNEIKVYKGTSINLEFICKDVDRKPVPLVNKKILITIFNIYTNELMVKKYAEIIDEYKGRIRFLLSPMETYHWKDSKYKFSIILEDSGILSPLYVDESQNAYGVLDFKTTMIPQPLEPIVITEFTPKRETNANQLDNIVFHTSPIAVTNYYKLTNDLFTVAIKMNNFTGTIELVGTLEATPPSSDFNWFNIPIYDLPKLEFENKNGLEVFNVRGQYLYIKFIIRNLSPINDEGNIEKITIKL